MSDLISKSEAIEAIENLVARMSVCLSADVCRGMRSMRERAVMAVKELPSEEPKIIRCKDCIWYAKDPIFDVNLCHRIHMTKVKTEDDSFCSYAEAKDGSN